MRRELQLRKLVRLPSSVPRQKFGHNAILHSAATSSFIKPNGGAKSTGQPSYKEVRMPNGQTISTSFKTLLLNTALNPKARQCDILPDLQHNLLVSVGKLSDAGYCTIFMPGNQDVKVVLRWKQSEDPCVWRSSAQKVERPPRCMEGTP